MGKKSNLMWISKRWSCNEFRVRPNIFHPSQFAPGTMWNFPKSKPSKFKMKCRLPALEKLRERRHFFTHWAHWRFLETSNEWSNFVCTPKTNKTITSDWSRVRARVWNITCCAITLASLCQKPLIPVPNSPSLVRDRIHQTKGQRPNLFP